MRAVIQRVKKANVVSNGVLTGEISTGLLVFLGIEPQDTEDDLKWLVRKLPQVRIFPDEAGLMNLSVKDIDGEILLISQFTLYGNLRKGTRPSFNRAAPPSIAIPLYDTFREMLANELGKTIPAGIFGADMQIEAHNDGPVTLILDTKQKDL